MRKFFAAVMLALILSTNNFSEAAQFTQEQLDQMISMTVQNPAAEKNSTLPVDFAAFQTNYNDFMNSFINETNAGTDAAMMRQIFLMNNLHVHDEGKNKIFIKNFSNRVMIIGLCKSGGKFKVMNFFSTHEEGRDDVLFDVLIMQAFVRGITPGFDATVLIDAANKNPNAPFIHKDVKYFLTSDGNLNIITAIAK